jgi:hypothetical protein
VCRVDRTEVADISGFADFGHKEACIYVPSDGCLRELVNRGGCTYYAKINIYAERRRLLRKGIV